uniref:Ig-like domain-containing protein n=1 Tax=Leptobrachium leishanense TaxID=445787 RepID=A0A8C5PI62_9ANUR
ASWAHNLILLHRAQSEPLQHLHMTQEPSVIASPGDNVRMSCTLGGGLTVSSNRVVFYQQAYSSVPRFILYYFTESSKGMGTGVPARFVGSAAGNVGYLSINGVRPEDEGDYYCATWTGRTFDLRPGGTSAPCPRPAHSQEKWRIRPPLFLWHER